MTETPVDPSSTEARYQRIWRVITVIPEGQVASYGQVAELAGIPRGARQVARALRMAPDDLELPWYRVISASGKIAMAPDSPGYKKQRANLLAEGVLVEEGRVNMRRFRWLPSSDEIAFRL